MAPEIRGTHVAASDETLTVLVPSPELARAQAILEEIEGEDAS